MEAKSLLLIDLEIHCDSQLFFLTLLMLMNMFAIIMILSQEELILIIFKDH